MSIAGIEGNSFSGKSELAMGLLPYGYSIINESSYYVESFPQPPYDLDSARKNLDFFAEVEKRRSEDALRMLQEGKSIVMDRTLWTYILYEYVLLKRFPEKPNVYQYSLDIFQKLAEEEDIVIPKILLCLTSGSEKVLKQRILQRRPAGIEFLNEWETTQVIDSALEKIIGVYGPQNAIKIVNNGAPEELISSGVEFLNRPLDGDIEIEEVFNKLRDIVEN
jgi:hypothetical protein